MRVCLCVYVCFISCTRAADMHAHLWCRRVAAQVWPQQQEEQLQQRQDGTAVVVTVVVRRRPAVREDIRSEEQLAAAMARLARLDLLPAAAAGTGTGWGR